MGPRLALSLAAAVLASAGCGESRAPLPATCTEGQATVTRALRAAPGAVRLAGGTPLSECVSAARDIGELQEFGVILTGVADRLADRAPRDPAAALRLGYLIGAAHRGAAHGEGVPLELVHRLEVTARRLPATTRAELDRGLRAGERTG